MNIKNIQNIKDKFTSFIGVSAVKQLLIPLLIILAALGVGGSYYFYEKYRAIKSNPDVEAKKETDALVLAVGKLIELPKNETPTVATVLDKEKLKDQPFFDAAENGDVLLAYTSAMKAILYRPKTNKIINVAPILINQPQNLTQGVKQNVSAPASLRIAYYNGTETPGLAGLTEKAVKAKYPNYQTAALKNASRKDYKGILVVDILGKYAKEAGDIATLLGGEIGNLPQGEIAPNADILIISGN